jgi:S1-C subfamily serine protease
VVHVRVEIPAAHPSAAVLGEERMGAGVAVSPEAVLTAHYLVMGASAAEVIGLDGRRRAVERVTLDHESGLALLALERPDLRPAQLNGSEPPRPGAEVFVLTCTGEKEWRGASGHVSYVGHFEAFWEYMLDGAIMTTIVNPGLAGGPLLDRRGRVNGIVSLGLGAVGRYSLAIPIGLFHAARPRLESGEPPPPAQRRAWVGFFPQASNGSVAVTGIVPGSPAEGAGLERGDLLLSVDGRPVNNLRQLYTALWRRAPGDAVNLQVLRDEAIRVIEVVAGDRYEFYK